MALVPLCHEFYEQQGCCPERVELNIPSLPGGPETSLFLTRFPHWSLTRFSLGTFPL